MGACTDAGPTATEPETLSLSIVGPSHRTGPVGQELTDPLTVYLETTQKNKLVPAKGVTVNFVVTQGGGKVYAGAAVTDANGLASDYWTLGPEPGENALEVRAVSGDGTKSLYGTFTATGQVPSWGLTVSTVSMDGVATGTVTSEPAGIDCGTDCTESYAQGTVVTLTAKASLGSSFVEWGGACTGTEETCQVTMDAARSVTATFTVYWVGLWVSKQGTGSGTVTSEPTGINCGTDCSESYSQGIRVTLTATPDTHSEFAWWEGGTCGGSYPTCVVEMGEDRWVTARFNVVTHTLTVLKAGTGSGTVTSEPAGINCGSHCTESYAEGTVVTLTATASLGSWFDEWSGACTGTASTCQVTMDARHSVTATFKGIF